MVTLNPGCQGIAFGILELHSLRSGLGQTEGALGQDRQTALWSGAGQTDSCPGMSENHSDLARHV